MKDYIGNPLQIRGAEQYILQNGKGNGMHFVYVRNGLGLEAWISVDRCADLSRVIFKGDNYSFMSPCGYVAPSYYDREGTAFLESFNAGFCTTCGLSNVGVPCEDGGVKYPMHGTVSNIPAELNRIDDAENGLTVEACIRDAVIFGKKLTLKRRYFFSYTENSIRLEDSVTNEADFDTPVLILYHCNMGYPLLSENSTVKIPNISCRPRDKEAADYADTALIMEKPQTQFAERCYYYDVEVKNGTANVGIYNKDINKGLVMSYDKTALPAFTEWKMMGKTDYVLGLEPGNCNPDGIKTVREQGKLRILKPDETENISLEFRFTENESEFNSLL